MTVHDAPTVHRGVRLRSSANLIHQDTQLKIDLFVAGGTPLDHLQIARRRMVTLGPGRTLPIRVQAEGLDTAYLRAHAPALGVERLLERALAEGGLPAQR